MRAASALATLAGEVPAALGKGLVLDLQRVRPRALEQLDRAHHV